MDENKQHKIVIKSSLVKDSNFKNLNKETVFIFS